MFHRIVSTLSVVSICAAVSFGARADISTVNPGSIGLDAAKLGKIEQALAKDVADGKVPGAVMLIARQGKVGFFTAAGFQTPEKKRPMTSKTIFRVYSMTKPIVSVAAMALVEDGRLSLDEPISSYIPYFAETTVFQQAGSSFMIKKDGARPARTQITVRDLMRHTSGMIYGVFDKGALGKLYKEAGAASSDIDLNQFSAVMAKLPLRFEPGTAWHYGRSTDVLGRVMEIASGQPLDEFLNDRIFKPLGMTDTAFFHGADKADRLAQGVKPLFAVTEPKPMLSGGGGLTSTMEDYLRFAMMLRNRGSLDGQRIIKPETLALMTQNHIAGLDRKFFYPGKAYGFGLGFAVRIADEGRYPGTLGDYWWRGYAGTYFWIDPRKDLFAIFLIQDPAKRVHYTGATRNWVYNALAK
jgi:CubicO group peptidase (beta-lactamase class C family)